MISVELVPDPDKTSKTQKWQEGQTAAQNPEQPPQQFQPPQVASLQQPQLQEPPVKEDPKAKEEAKSEDEAKPEEDAPKAEEEKQFGPTLPDLNTLVDAAAADLDRKIKDALDRKRQQQQAARATPGRGTRRRAADPRHRRLRPLRSVLAQRHRRADEDAPRPFALWGRVLVSFQISESGRSLTCTCYSRAETRRSIRRRSTPSARRSSSARRPACRRTTAPTSSTTSSANAFSRIRASAPPKARVCGDTS